VKVLLHRASRPLPSRGQKRVYHKTGSPVKKLDLVSGKRLETTPGHKWDFHFTTPSTYKVDSHSENTPHVLGTGAIAIRHKDFLYHETFLARNVAFEIPTS
jgi:hypothetical protein